MSGWLDEDEVRAERKALALTLSFEAVANKHCNAVEPISSSTWTHKCTCPFHKGGNERTPSLHMSDTEKTFFCYGCGARGDIFDFIGIIRGSPGDSVAAKYKSSKNISIDVGEVAASKKRIDVQEINLQISVVIREYLRSLAGTDLYKIEADWANSTFRRIDERFARLTDSDGEQAKHFQMQIMLELDRRKMC